MDRRKAVDLDAGGGDSSPTSTNTQGLQNSKVMQRVRARLPQDPLSTSLTVEKNRKKA